MIELSISVVKVNDKPASVDYKELIMDSSSDVSSLPTNVADGSVAYTADLSSIYIFKNGTWVSAVV